MKKQQKFIITAALAGAVLAATPGYAAPITSDGEVSFTPFQGQIDPVKPGTDETVTIVDGSNNQVNVNDVHLTHVPDFKFGSNETSLSTKEYNVLHERFKTKDSAATYTIPQFVQVADVSGKQGTNWKVTLEQEALLKENGGHTLKNSRIKIYNQSLTNNVNQINVENLISGLELTGTDPMTIPVKSKDGGAIPVLSSKAGKTDETTTNGTISSVVFKKEYKESDYGKATSPALTDRNEDVRLSVPQSDGVQAKNYQATLNWELTVEP